MGAGGGSYEPPRTVPAVEPSQVMISQRPAGAAPVVRAVAEHLPLRDDTVDAAMALLTVHHWADLAAGIRELRRVARRRVVVLTWDQRIFRERFRLVRDHLPEAAAFDDRRAVPTDRLIVRLCDASALGRAPPRFTGARTGSSGRGRRGRRGVGHQEPRPRSRACRDGSPRAPLLASASPEVHKGLICTHWRVRGQGP
ncbi:methyltransferase domain-containing protein [Streptomyces olivaceoviridis]|uniref:methyltransferase domain-containing protein n=1 Tax=Streptomyces olivaceoviridis TaxID=1921 RepID=UPI00369375E9